MRSRAMHRVNLRRSVVILLFIVLAPLVSARPVHAAPHREGAVIYVVRSGDRLGDIAARYGTTVSAIVRANGLTNPDFITPGQRLVISTSGAASSSGTSGSAASTGSYYTVRRGDTLSTIAAAHRVSASAIVRANGIANADMIYVGQRLLIPSGSQTASSSSGSATSTTASTSRTIHVVQSGDTLSQIAKRYGTTVAALVAENGLGSADLLRVGTRLAIPRSGSSTSYPGQATRFVVSISQQRCWLYRGDTVISKWVCSTGREGAATRPGTYRIQSKMERAYGSTWNIWMPYWLGIYWAGTSENGIHGLPYNAKSGAQLWAGHVGTPITFGCVMLDNVNAKMLYDMAYIGMPVVIQR